MGPRAAKDTDLIFRPGVASNAPGRDLKGRWKDSNRVRWHKGYPEKIRGWSQLPVTGLGQPGAGDLSSVLLMHMESGNGSTSFVDSSVYNHAITSNGTPLLPVSNVNPKFGAGAGLFTDAFGTQYWSVPYASEFDFSTGDWTIEFWIRFDITATRSFSIFQNNFTSVYNFQIVVNNFSLDYNSPDNTGTTRIRYNTSYAVDNAWHHIAVVRSGSNFLMFRDGIRFTTGPAPGPYAGALGQNGATITMGGLDLGAVDEIRFSNVARYTANFTPPTAAFPDPTPTASALYTGTVRGATDWASLDGEKWIAFGTECKLYDLNRLVVYDITPIRKTSNLTNPFATVNGSAVVTVTDLDHRAGVGDHINIQAATIVGNILLDGDYNIVSIVDPDSYTITGGNLANATASGGGSPTINYDIYCGLAKNGELLGYGTGVYGSGTYGTPRAVGTGVQARMRTWSMSNWGEDLVASYSDGEIYWWDRSAGPSSHATLIANAPTDVQRILVNPENRYLIALGCSGLDGVADPMRVRWCSQEDFNDWTPTTLNTAGGKRLDYGSRLVTGVLSRQQILVWSDTQLYRMQYLGAPLIFGFDPLGKCSIVGPNAAVDVNGSAYFMGFDDFFIYDGTLRPLVCDIWETIFGKDGYFDRTQAEGTYCASYQTKSEVTWFYPTIDASIRYVTFNYAENCWYGGIMLRTCYRDVSPAITGYFERPYGFNNGFIYQHETGVDEVEGLVTNAMDWFFESWDIGSQSDEPKLITGIVPDFQRLVKGVQFKYIQRAFPRMAGVEQGPFVITPNTAMVDERALGSQVALRIERATHPVAIVSPSVMLLHMDGNDGSTTFNDSSYVQSVMTVAGPVISTAGPKFGTGAGRFNNAGSVQTPITPGGPLDIYSGDFTIEFWFKWDGDPGGPRTQVMMDYGDFAITGGIRCYTVGSSVTLQCSFFHGWSDISHPAVLVADTWYACAIVRIGNQGSLFINGVKFNATTPDWTTVPGTTGPTFFLGRSSNSGIQSSFFNGQMDEFRVTKGVGLYTANYVPAEAPFTVSTQDVIVYGQDFRMGTWQASAVNYGGRMAEAPAGDPIDTSGP